MFVLKVLEDKEFDKLPFKHVKESLGCADPKTKTAYVRNTHWGEASKAINLLTIQHEIEELVAKTSPHEEDGIRYKKGGVLRNILPFALGLIPGIGPILGAAANIGMNQYAQSNHPEQLGAPGNIMSIIGQGASGYFGAKAVGGASAGLFAPQTAQTSMGTVLVKPTIGAALSNAASGAAGALGFGGGVPSATTATMQPSGFIGTAAGTAGASAGTLAGMSAATGSIAPTVSSSVPSATTLLSQAAGMGGVAGGSTVSSPNSAVAGSNDALAKIIKGTSGGAGSITPKNILSGLDNPMTKLGLGAMGLSAMPLSAPSIQYGDIVSKWLTADTVTKAGEVAKGIADTNYTGEWQPDKETLAYTEVMGKSIEKAYTARKEQLDNMNAAVNPNWARSGERLEMYRKMDADMQSEVDTMKSQWLLSSKQTYATQQYNYVMQNLSADEATKRDLLYADLAEVTAKYNMQQEDILNFRKIAADAGMYAVQQGMGIN
jgi:hypothetical protein